MENTLSIATYNLQACNHPDALLQTIDALREQTDIMCLQELSSSPHKAGFLPKLQKLLGSSWDIQTFVATEYADDFGLAIAWRKDRFTYFEKKELLLPMPHAYAIGERIVKSLLGLSGNKIERKALSVVLMFHNKKIQVTNLHLSLEGGLKQRIRQLAFIQDVLHNSYAHEMYCGDFNTLHFDKKLPSEHKKIQDILSQFTDITENISVTADVACYTYPTRINKLFFGIFHIVGIHLNQKLDYIWVKGFVKKHATIIHSPASDHFPVLTTLAINSL